MVESQEEGRKRKNTESIFYVWRYKADVLKMSRLVYSMSEGEGKDE